MVDDIRSLKRDLAKALQAAKQAAQVAAGLADSVQALTVALGLVNAKTQRTAASISGLAVTSVDQTVTWPDLWPDTQYGVYVSVVSGTAALGGLHATLKPGTKTNQDCVITVANTGLAAVGAFALDVLGVRT